MWRSSKSAVAANNNGDQGHPWRTPAVTEKPAKRREPKAIWHRLWPYNMRIKKSSAGGKPMPQKVVV